MDKEKSNKLSISKYSILHTKVRDQLPMPDFCPKCGEKKKLELSNNGQYNDDLKNWEYLCRQCHVKKDRPKSERKKKMLNITLDLHEKLRKRAFTDRISMNQIIVEALKSYLL